MIDHDDDDDEDEDEDDRDHEHDHDGDDDCPGLGIWAERAGIIVFVHWGSHGLADKVRMHGLGKGC